MRIRIDIDVLQSMLAGALLGLALVSVVLSNSTSEEPEPASPEGKD